MKAIFAALAASAVLAGCAGSGQRAASVERLYVIECGENHVRDLSRFTGLEADKGRAQVFSVNCYLIRHAKGWMLWDTGNADRLAALPNGNPTPISTAFMKKPLAESLRQLGVAPADIQHFALSHFHGDHSGNANDFAASTLYMQAPEYDAIFGPEPQKYNVPVANFEKLRGAKTVKLNGDHDVFGDGSVLIKAAPGHTPGHQVLFVRLPKSAPVLLSGDMVHLQSNWEAKRAPSFNFNRPQSIESMHRIDAFLKASGARLWINHDMAQSRTIPKAPAWVE
jgi:glyoxylase-like metal-dependent hydrolase (beta-lactamase superfamily II)